MKLLLFFETMVRAHAYIKNKKKLKRIHRHETKQKKRMANEIHNKMDKKYEIVAVFSLAFRCRRKVDEFTVFCFEKFTAWNFLGKHIELFEIGLRFDHQIKYVCISLFYSAIQLSLHAWINVIHLRLPLVCFARYSFMHLKDTHLFITIYSVISHFIFIRLNFTVFIT